ncbi:muscle-specific protein 300 kDa-like isoform X2 [Armigeres subalbatus]|uniref:muscle-specific protein 300 kDa-like isoform X2 n=1 Tax=Armigeres subalbatus TaxID=124917 RepID=UPI002ED0D592
MEENEEHSSQEAKAVIVTESDCKNNRNIDTTNVAEQFVADRIKVIEECILESDEHTVPLQHQIVLPTDIIEAIYVEDVHQQTSPVQTDLLEDETDREIAFITSDNMLAPLSFEQKSSQTSPDNGTVKLSQQTSPITVQPVFSDYKEVQTELNLLDTETQTTDVAIIEQIIQTELGQPEANVNDIVMPKVSESANQTIIIEKTESETQTLDDVQNLVEPILYKIIDTTVEIGKDASRQSVQTSPIDFTELKTKSDAPPYSRNEFVQTMEIDVVDMQTSTEQTYKDTGSSPAKQLHVTEIETQTSPVHVTNTSVEQVIMFKNDASIKTEVEENIPITHEQADAQVQTFTTSYIPETIVKETQTSAYEAPISLHRKEKKKSKSKKGKSSQAAPIELEVQTELHIPEHDSFEPVTITKTIEHNAKDSDDSLNVQIQVEIQHPLQTDTCKEISYDVFEDKSWIVNLADYFSIIRSQRSYAEDKAVPWKEIKEMLLDIWPQITNNRRPDYFYKPLTFDDLEDNPPDTKLLLSMLNENSSSPEVQNRILFDTLERMNVQAEDIASRLCPISEMNEADRLRLYTLCKIRLQCISDKIECLTRYILESGMDSQFDIIGCLEQTKKGISDLYLYIIDEEDMNKKCNEDIHHLSNKIQQASNHLEDIHEKVNSTVLESSLSVSEKLSNLENIEHRNNEYIQDLSAILNDNCNSNSITTDAHLEENLKKADNMSKKIQQTITVERNKLIQLSSLAEEYEQTLLEFEEIATAAADFIENDISTNSLKELEEEMQRYRKFFVNLSHCKMILESLESNLDPITRTKHAKLHSALYNKTSIILERAVDRAARLAQAASKWTVIEKEMRDEIQWLQVAQQRIPDLQNVTSEDYEQYIKLYESLKQDILRHHTKMMQHNEIARKMQELICAPALVKDSSEALTVVTNLKEEVLLYLIKLQKFKNFWSQYNAAADKLHEWICHAQKQLNSLTIPQNLADTSVEDMRKFWEIKAQYEVMNNKVYENACSSLDDALATINITDEDLQRQLFGQLLENWSSTSNKIMDIQNHIYDSIKTTNTSSNDKITFIEKELRDINSTFNTLKGVLKSSEELYLYIEKMQMLKTRVYIVDTELGQLALASDFNVEKITELFEISSNISHQINEEYEAAENFYKCLENIEIGIKKQENRFLDITKVLDECGARINGKRPDVEQSLNDCKICQSELSDSWNEMMKLRQMLHTLPMNLKVSVSPQQTERDLSILQNIHSDLERKCENIISQLRDRLSLWNKFYCQLEIIQNHIHETEFMMDLIQLQETADYYRLLKATERLDALLVEIESRNETVDDLQNIAKPLIETSEAGVSMEIQETVEQMTALWQNTQENLQNLCQRYENAVKLWDRYNEISEGVKECISQSILDSARGKDIANFQTLEHYQASLNERKQDLNKLKNYIRDINEQVGFNIANTMMSEIDEFSKRMDDISEDITFQLSAASSSQSERSIKQTAYAASNAIVTQVQQDLHSSIPDSEFGSTLMDLETNLLNLSATESHLKTIASEKGSSRDEMYPAFENLHMHSLTLLQEAIHQHQKTLQQMVLEKDYCYLLEYWGKFLHRITTFVDQNIPSEYSKLQQHRDQYNVISHLVRQWQTSMLKITRNDDKMKDSYVALHKHHKECVKRINGNITDIEEKLLYWRKFKSSQTTLQEAIITIEAEKYNLQMEYINMKELSKLITKVINLQTRFSGLRVVLNNIDQEVEQLISSLADDHTIVAIKTEHGRIKSKLSKLEESVNTWKIFLLNVSELYSSLNSQCNDVNKSLIELGHSIETFKLENPVTSQHHLNMLKNEKLRLEYVKEELKKINLTKEELQCCISPFDAKLISKRVCSLWQLLDKLENAISVSLRQMQNRIQNRKLFLNQYNLMMEWIIKFDKRLNDSNKYEICEEDSNFIKSVEDTLLQEMSCKESEIAWFNVIGNDLMEALLSGEELTEIGSKQKHLNDAWEKLVRHCQERRQKISEVSSTSVSLHQRIIDIRAWMTQIELELKQPFMFEDIEKSCLDKLLDDYEKLQRSVESNSGNIAEILNLCEMLFTDVESWNVHINRKLINHDVKSLEMRWKNICIDTGRRKQDLLSIWSMLDELLQIIDSQHIWIDETNRFLDDIDCQCDTADNETLCTILQELSTKFSDIAGREPILQILRTLYFSLNKHSRVDRSNMQQITMTAKHVLLVWEKLMLKFESVKTRIEELTHLFSSFNSEYENIIVALTHIDVEVTNVKHLDDGTNAQTSETKLKHLRDLHNKLRFVINMFDAQDELGSSLIQLLPDNSKMSQKVQNQIMEYHQLANNIKHTLDSLVDQTNQGKISLDKSERDYAVQVDTLSPLSITAKDAYLYQLQTAIAEAKSNLAILEASISEINASNFLTSTQTVSKASAACESSIELIKHLNIILTSECHCNDEEAMSSAVKKECDRYSHNLTEWRLKQQKLEELSPFPATYNFICAHNEDYLTCPLCTNRNWQQIDNDLWRLEQWLSMAETTQKSQHTHPPNDIDTLEDNIQDHREFLLDLDSHKSIIKSLNIVGEHLATHTLDTEKAIKLRERLHSNNMRWDKVCNQSSQWQAQLHRALMENKEFHRTITELSTWLEQTEHKIKSSEPIDLTMDKSVIERKYKIFMELRNDLVRCEPRIVSLQETTSQLTKYLDDNTSQKFNEIYAKLTDLRLRFHSIRRLVEVYTVKIASAIGIDRPLDMHAFSSGNAQRCPKGRRRGTHKHHSIDQKLSIFRPRIAGISSYSSNAVAIARCSYPHAPW